MINLIGSTRIGNRIFTEADSTGAVPVDSKVSDDSWYGGNVKSFLKTKDGFLLCRDKRENIINIAYIEDELTAEGKALLSGEPVPQKSIEEMDRKELIAMAKELGIPGKLATMKTEELIKEIKECL